MQPFEFQSTHDEAGALQLATKSPGTRVLAGGTNLVDLMKLNVETPDHVIDISPLGWKQIKDAGSSMRVGALVTNSDLAHHAGVQKHFPALSQAILAGASVQLRNLATTAGNVLQRTRCPYFRDTAFACNKRVPGSGCSAIDGFQRNLAILGVSKACIASNPSDMNVALMAFDATIHVKGRAGDRTIPFGEFFRLPGETPQLETNLQAGELITAVEVPKTPWFTKSVYVKVRDRASYAFALTSAAVALDLHDGVIRDARIALGGVGAIPWRAKEAEKVLRGQKLTSSLVADAATAALAGAEPRKGNAFKVDLAQRTIVRAIQQLAGGVA